MHYRRSRRWANLHLWCPVRPAWECNVPTRKTRTVPGPIHSKIRRTRAAGASCLIYFRGLVALVSEPHRDVAAVEKVGGVSFFFEGVLCPIVWKMAPFGAVEMDPVGWGKKGK